MDQKLSEDVVDESFQRLLPALLNGNPLLSVAVITITPPMTICLSPGDANLHTHAASFSPWVCAFPAMAAAPFRIHACTNQLFAGTCLRWRGHCTHPGCFLFSAFHSFCLPALHLPRCSRGWKEGARGRTSSSPLLRRNIKAGYFED